MNKHSYYKSPTSNPLLLENKEEKRLIHQFHHRTIELDLESIRGKNTLNEIR